MAETTITNEEKVQAILAPITLAGKPAQVDGKPAWSIISGDSTLEVADDGLSAFLVSSDTLGDTIYQAKADADLGEGVEELILTVKLTVVSARAANLGLTFATPIPK